MDAKSPYWLPREIHTAVCGMLPASDCSAYRCSYRLGRDLICVAFLMRRINRWLASSGLTDIFAIKRQPSRLTRLEGVLALVGVGRCEMSHVSYLLGLLCVLEESGDWEGWIWRLRVMQQLGALTEAFPITITPADLRKLPSKAIFRRQPESLRQYMLFGHKVRGPAGCLLLLTPLDEEGRGMLGQKRLVIHARDRFRFRASYDVTEPACDVSTQHIDGIVEMYSSFRDAVIDQSLPTDLTSPDHLVTREDACRISKLAFGPPPVDSRRFVVPRVQSSGTLWHVFLCDEEACSTAPLQTYACLYWDNGAAARQFWTAEVRPQRPRATLPQSKARCGLLASWALYSCTWIKSLCKRTP
ncbi:unnamed protein product [Vitrella brassicaformis CCMP3155]|uniref:Uncharacterized protein n=1 Tax=Vitrella brassicaformis (strain CCMP3155) TaxID=1169540 RepID=A0A0G4EVF4_VITBC|nr:unnamed protein product [Vitrella brassicaformis CCMP3155]|mmetsp:Transcript_1751/g.4833  ORF Transcript_1751/g.4833 Transcript_1751/m.4833 type:complete len:357 (+) Transcript_1751:56-1126(+)|eukprot:CEM02251.1 unnamed protein product [Vitrella brassicaformis CCMP3155]